MFTVGKPIRDPAGNNWTITQVWEIPGYICLGLIGASGPMYGQMGGTRIPYENDLPVNA